MVGTALMPEGVEHKGIEGLAIPTGVWEPL